MSVLEPDQPISADMPVSLSLEDADLVESLRDFVGLMHLEVEIRPDVSGSVTLEFEDTPWLEGLQHILRINNLGRAYEENGVMVIDTIANLAAEMDSMRERQRVRTVMKTLNSAGATEVADHIRESGFLGETGTIQVDRRTNTLIIRTRPNTVSAVLLEIDRLEDLGSVPDAE